MTMSNEMGSERKFSQYEEQESQVRWGRGVDANYWGDWCGLAQAVNSHFTFDERENSYSREKNEKSWQEYFKDMLFCRGIFKNDQERNGRIIKKYASGRFHAKSKEEFERKFPVQTHFGLDFDKVRRLDELAEAVNDSIRRAIKTDRPLDWTFYYAACLEAERIFFDEGKCLIYPVSWYSPVDKVRAKRA